MTWAVQRATLIHMCDRLARRDPTRAPTERAIGPRRMRLDVTSSAGLVFAVALVTALATGLGACRCLPFRG